MERDIGETSNVADAHPEVVSRLCAMADVMRARLGDSSKGIVGSELRAPGRIPALTPDGARKLTPTGARAGSPGRSSANRT